nr:mechanosensitive ion channel [Parachlamydiaceae bacterium]
IYFNQPFTVGDWIHLPEKNIEGIVEDIGWYMTRIRSLDKRPIFIPNSIFSKIVVITPSRMSHRQIKETLPLRPEDMPKLKAVITDIKNMIQHHPDVDRNQTILVYLAALSPSSIDVTIDIFIPYCDKANFMRIKEDVLFKISAILSKHEVKLASIDSLPSALIAKMLQDEIRYDERNFDKGQEITDSKVTEKEIQDSGSKGMVSDGKTPGSEFNVSPSKP